MKSMDLKRLVDSATEKIQTAGLEEVGLALGFTVGHRQGSDRLRTLQVAAETLRSPKFEAAVWQARAKMENSLAWQLRPENQ
jgi:hypothetical protein